MITASQLYFNVRKKADKFQEETIETIEREFKSRIELGKRDVEPPWVNCSDRLPDEDHHVLMCSAHVIICVGYLDGNTWYSFPCHRRIGNITHWQKIQPPKD